MEQVLERYRDRLEAVEAEMRACFPEVAGRLAPFYGMMAYHLGWKDAAFRPVAGRTGKRLRPLLCLLATEAVGGTWQRALPAAAAVELLHNFTLIHDDIEDRSPLRRGRPTVWSVWGIPQAINAGDGLFVLARMALFRLREQGFSPETVLQAIALLDGAILRICEGQYLDLSFEGDTEVSEAAYAEMIAAKTAALIEVAMHLGALVGGGADREISALRRYATALGLAFQVQDDLLGVWGKEEETGKPAAADLYNRKLGLPVIHALAHAPAPERAELAQAYRGEAPLDARTVQRLLEILEGAGSRRYTEDVAAAYYARALAALADLPDSPARRALEEIASLLLGRSA
ncbi:MAG: polyprenyl synthetase family protein [Chloroflexia bacterium]